MTYSNWMIKRQHDHRKEERGIAYAADTGRSEQAANWVEASGGNLNSLSLWARQDAVERKPKTVTAAGESSESDRTSRTAVSKPKIVAIEAARYSHHKETGVGPTYHRRESIAEVGEAIGGFRRARKSRSSQFVVPDSSIRTSTDVAVWTVMEVTYESLMQSATTSLVMAPRHLPTTGIVPAELLTTAIEKLGNLMTRF